jgi:hypothetical protein
MAVYKGKSKKRIGLPLFLVFSFSGLFKRYFFYMPLDQNIESFCAAHFLVVSVFWVGYVCAAFLAFVAVDFAFAAVFTAALHDAGAAVGAL